MWRLQRTRNVTAKREGRQKQQWTWNIRSFYLTATPRYKKNIERKDTDDGVKFWWEGEITSEKE